MSEAVLALKKYVVGLETELRRTKAALASISQTAMDIQDEKRCAGPSADGTVRGLRENFRATANASSTVEAITKTYESVALRGMQEESL